MTILSEKWLKETLLQLLKFAKSTDKRLREHDQRFAEIDLRFDGVDQKFETIDNKLDKMTNQLDSLVGMHKTTEVETAALKAGLKRHGKRIDQLEHYVIIPENNTF